MTRYRCAICGARLIEGRYVYSRFTKSRYCIDMKKHERLAARRRKQKSA